MAALTEKQEAFAIEYMANGGNAGDAYCTAYNVKEGTTKAAIYSEGFKLKSHPAISLRIHELRMQRYSKKILTIDERKEILSELVAEGDLKAMEILNKMEGVYIDKVEHSGSIIKRTINVNPTKDN